MKKILWILVLCLLFSGISYAEWTIQKENNEFENKQSTYIISENALPNKKLSFPYENTEVNLVVGCTKYTEWVYFFFNTVNLNYDTFNSNGDQVTDISVKVGDRIYGIEVYSESGSNFVMVSKLDKKRMLKYIRENNSIMAQFDHYGNGKRHYVFNTSNFEKTFDENCK